MSVRGHARPLLVCGAAAVMLVGTFLPWVLSGATPRSSYELLAVIGRLRLADDGVEAMAVRWWPVVPLLVTTAATLAWPRSHRLATAAMAAGLAASAYAAALSIVVLRAAAAARPLVRPAAGPVVTLIGALCLAAAVVARTAHAGRDAQPAVSGDPPPDH